MIDLGALWRRLHLLQAKGERPFALLNVQHTLAVMLRTASCLCLHIPGGNMVNNAHQ